jgi:hypothetical protein
MNTTRSPRFDVGITFPGVGARHATSAGMYPELRSSAIFASVTLEASHLSPRALLAIAGKEGARIDEGRVCSRRGLEAGAGKDVRFVPVAPGLYRPPIKLMGFLLRCRPSRHHPHNPIMGAWDIQTAE